MFHPVGSQPPAVYWRRRAVFIAVAALAFLTLYAVLLRGGSSGKVVSSGTTTASRSTPVANQSAVPVPATSVLPATSTPVVTTPAVTSPLATSPAAPSTPAETTALPPSPVACLPTQLAIGAASDAKSYPVGAKPKLSLTVKNNGPQPCIADLSDAKIELRVMSGSVRVWGSHDCAIAPGTSLQTLVVGAPVRREIQWSGLSSEPGCAGQRQVAPAGSYTVIALLAGQASAPVAFSLS